MTAPSCWRPRPVRPSASTSSGWGRSGRPGSPALVFTLPASSVPAFAVSPDASLLGYATPGGIGVVSLTTGARRSWTAAGGEVVGLSWAGDKALAFAWAGTAAGEIRSVTVRLLATSPPGSRLMAARQLVPVCANSNGQLCLEQHPLGAAGGRRCSSPTSSTAMAPSWPTWRSSPATPGASSSATNHWRIRLPPPRPARRCGPSPAGEQLAVYCAGSTTIVGGRAAGLHVPVNSSAVQNQTFAW